MTEETSVDRAPVDAVVMLTVIESCDGCGACCMEQCSPPFLGPTDPELATLPPSVLADYRRGMEQRDRDGWPDAVPCFWFDSESRKCRHYEHRPEICREALIRGDDGCRLWRGLFGIEAA